MGLGASHRPGKFADSKWQCNGQEECQTLRRPHWLGKPHIIASRVLEYGTQILRDLWGGARIYSESPARSNSQLDPRDLIGR
jgi:hypothetical protein